MPNLARSSQVINTSFIINKVVLCALTVILSTITFASYSFELDAWKQYKSKNFVMFSDRNEDDVRQTLREFEIFRASVKQLLNISDELQLAPVTIYDFDSASDFRKYTDSPQVRGFYTYRDNGPIIVKGPGRKRELMTTTHVLYHEYIHYLVRARGGLNYPTWYDEGVAEMFSTMDVHDDKVVLGALPPLRAQTIQRFRIMNLENLFGVGAYRSSIENAKIYASGWLATHFFTFGPYNGFTDYQVQLANMFRYMNTGMNAKQAYAEAFDTSYEALKEEIHRYSKLRNFQVVEMNVNVDLAEIEVTALSEKNAASELAYLSQQMFKNTLAQTTLDSVSDIDTPLSIAIRAFYLATHTQLSGTNINNTIQRLSKAIGAIQSANDHMVQNLIGHSYQVLAEKIEVALKQSDDETHNSQMKAQLSLVQDASFTHYQRANAIKPTYVAFRNIANYYWKNKQKQKAIDSAIMGYNLASSTTDANFFVGEYMLKIDNYELAEFFLSNVVNWTHSEALKAHALTLLEALPKLKPEP